MPALLSLFLPILSCHPMFVLTYLSISTLLSPLVLTLSRSFVPALLSPMPAFSSFFVPVFPSFFMSVLSSRSVLSPAPTYFIFLALGVFKQTLLNKFLQHRLTYTSLVELFYLFPTLSLLLEKNNRKRLSDIAFINSFPLAENYAAKKIDQISWKCRCPIQVKFNRF